jgi:hypothetical protein
MDKIRSIMDWITIKESNEYTYVTGNTCCLFTSRWNLWITVGEQNLFTVENYRQFRYLRSTR